MEKKTTLCVECAYILDPKSKNPLCLINFLPVKKDPADGKEKPFITDRFNEEIFVSWPYKFCRDCNSGYCWKFTQKESSLF